MRLEILSPLKIAGIVCLGLASTASMSFSQEIVFKNSRPAGSLVELYSSEGCSSCPPAEEWLNHLKSAPGLWKDVFPVGFHVDYWDNLGWPDRFARADYTQRQRNYAARLGQDSVYTPEFVVNGAEWRRGWFDNQGFPEAGTKKSGELSIAVDEKDKRLSAVYKPATAIPETSLVLNVALLGFNVVSDVTRGENGGRKLEHDFVVLDFRSTALAPKSGTILQSGPVDMTSSTGDSPGAVVAWVSASDGTILQVAGGWLAVRN